MGCFCIFLILQFTDKDEWRIPRNLIYYFFGLVGASNSKKLPRLRFILAQAQHLNKSKGFGLGFYLQQPRGEFLENQPIIYLLENPYLRQS